MKTPAPSHRQPGLDGDIIDFLLERSSQSNFKKKKIFLLYLPDHANNNNNNNNKNLIQI